MSIDEIEALLRRYLRAGMTVVVLLVAPGADVEELVPGEPDVITVEPDAAAPDSAVPPGTQVIAPFEDLSPDEPTDPGSAASGTTAGERLGWGAPDRADEFDGGLEQWEPHTGPGHDGRGSRSAENAAVADGVLTIAGDATGTTAGLAWHPGQRYGRWEGRVRAPASDPSYDALLLLWPDAEDFPEGGEIDFMEMRDPSRQETDLFLHHGPDNEQVDASVQVDGTQWHNWALEWTPEAITAYVDGEEWFRSTDTTTFPPGPMHLCIQLDWFPEGDDAVPQESTMQVDWVRQWSFDATDGSAGAGAETETETETETEIGPDTDQGPAARPSPDPIPN